MAQSMSFECVSQFESVRRFYFNILKVLPAKSLGIDRFFCAQISISKQTRSKMTLLAYGTGS